MTQTSPTPSAPTSRLGVDVWLDVACPWCAVGERRLSSVLGTLPFSEDVDVRFHSFQLDPAAPERSELKQHEYLAARGVDMDKVHGSLLYLNAMGEELGIHFDHEAVVPSNTYTAHRLIQAAGEAGVQEQVVQALFSGYFEHGLDVGDAAAVREVVTAAGLPGDVADRVLADAGAYQDEVDEDVARAGQLGIQGVPFYVLDGRYGLSGAQSPDVFERALTQVYGELNPAPAQPLQTLPGQDGPACGPDGCEA